MDKLQGFSLLFFGDYYIWWVENLLRDVPFRIRKIIFELILGYDMTAYYTQLIKCNLFKNANSTPRQRFVLQII